MNKRKFNKVMSLYRDGVAVVSCMSAMIDMSISATESGHWCAQFHSAVMLSVLEDLRLTSSELKEVKDRNLRLCLELEKRKQIDELICSDCTPKPGGIIRVDANHCCLTCGRKIVEGEPYSEYSDTEKSTNLDDQRSNEGDGVS